MYVWGVERIIVKVKKYSFLKVWLVKRSTAALYSFGIEN